MKYRHMKIDPKPTAVTSLNIEIGNSASELELLFVMIQGMLDEKKSCGKKGKKFSNGQKLTYKKAQALLYELYKFFAIKGCFSFGICGNCEYFENGCSTHGMVGYCSGQEKHAFDSCDSHSEIGKGFSKGE